MAENNGILSIPGMVLTIGLFAGQNAAATTVYQWTDEDGVVHFSDIAPNDKISEGIEEIEFVDYENPAAEEDRYSISNQLERMTEWRRQVTEERLAQKQLQLEAKRLARERDASRYNNYSLGDQSYYTPSYYYPPTVWYSSPGYFNGHGFRHRNRVTPHPYGGFPGKFGGGTVSRSKIDLHY